MVDQCKHERDAILTVAGVKVASVCKDNEKKPQPKFTIKCCDKKFKHI